MQGQQRAGVQEGYLSKNFQVHSLVGKGSFGAVYKAQRRSDGQVYAIKEVDVRGMRYMEREDAVNEVRLLASLTHVNVLAYQEAFIEGNKMYIVMEYAPLGDLHTAIRRCQTTRRTLPEPCIWRYFLQVLQGLGALHSLGILHRDIKPLNIMLAANNVVKIGDLGIAKLLDSKMTNTQIGTPPYMAPEQWRAQPYSYGCDMWALGCLLYELTTLRLPFDGRNVNEVKAKVCRGFYAPLPSTCSPDIASLVRQLLNPIPSQRPTVATLLASDIVKRHLDCLPPEVLNPQPSAGAVLPTIKVPASLQQLNRMLPPAKYCLDGFSQASSSSNQSAVKIAQAAQERERPKGLPLVIGSKAVAGMAGKGPVNKVAEVGNAVRPAGMKISRSSEKVKSIEMKVKEEEAKVKRVQVQVGARAQRGLAWEQPVAIVPQAAGPRRLAARDIMRREIRQNRSLEGSKGQLPGVPMIHKALPAVGTPVAKRPLAPLERPQAQQANEAILQNLRARLAELEQMRGKRQSRMPGVEQGKGGQALGGGNKKPGAQDSPSALYQQYKQRAQQGNWQYNVRPQWMI